MTQTRPEFKKRCVGFFWGARSKPQNGDVPPWVPMWVPGCLCPSPSAPTPPGGIWACVCNGADAEDGGRHEQCGVACVCASGRFSPMPERTEPTKPLAFEPVLQSLRSSVGGQLLRPIRLVLRRQHAPLGPPERRVILVRIAPSPQPHLRFAPLEVVHRARDAAVAAEHRILAAGHALEQAPPPPPPPPPPPLPWPLSLSLPLPQRQPPAPGSRTGPPPAAPQWTVTAPLRPAPALAGGQPALAAALARWASNRRLHRRRRPGEAGRSPRQPS